MHGQHLVAACCCQTDKLCMGVDLGWGCNIQFWHCRSLHDHFRREQAGLALQQSSMVYYGRWKKRARVTASPTMCYVPDGTSILLLLKLPECRMADCVTCRTIRQTREQACMTRFMSTDLALRKGLAGQGLTADGGEGIGELCDILGLDRFKCSNHLTGMQQHSILKCHGW